MNEPKYEYRVVYNRGVGKKWHIRQSLYGANERVRRLLWADRQAIKENALDPLTMDPYADLRFRGMPPLQLLKIERRVVGEWEDFEL